MPYINRRFNTFIKLFINVLICLYLPFTSHTVFAQVFNTDQYPPHLRWRQITTENFQLIYPVEIESQAQVLARNLEYMVGKVGSSLNKKPRKISIILQNQTVESNGNVQLAPRRSEFFTTPPQQGDFQNWLNNLAVHELRHVVQFDKLTGYLRAPFFEQLALALYGVNLPSWFFEGDAVITETILTDAGRGRLPSWEMPFRTNLLSGKKYSYQKDYLGSLKSITPGFYELGYFMTARMQREHGAGIVDSLMTRMSKFPIRPYNFSNSLKKFTGYNTRQWHEETSQELTRIWQAQLTEINPQDYPVLPDQPAGKPQSWLLPRALSGGDIIALYESAQEVPAIVVLDSTGQQRELVKTGAQTAPHFSYASGRIVWDEVRRHSRFGKRTYSVVNLYDINTGSYRQLTRRSRYFSPVLSADGKRIAAVEVDEANTVSLVILDVDNGAVIAQYPAPASTLLQTPSFDTSGTKIVATAVSQAGANLMELEMDTGTYDTLMTWQQQQIERPFYAGDHIIFKAHYNGIDNIYALDRRNGRVRQVTNARFGAFNPSYDNQTGRLWFNNYQVDGFRISSVLWDDKAGRDLGEIRNSHISYFKPLLTKEKQKTANTSGNDKIFASTAYNHLKNLINFHSLSVDNGNFENLDDINPGIYWLSDDLLNTTQVRLGYLYDGDIRSSEYRASIGYHRFFPRFTLEYRNRGQAGSATISNGTEETRIGLRWRENETSFKMEIPLVFYRLNRVVTTGFSTATLYTSRYDLSEPHLRNRFISHIRFPLHYQAYFNHYTRPSLLDIAPRWGQYLSITYRHFPFEERISGDHFAIRTSFYFPGLLPNHSLLARFNYQHGRGAYEQGNDIPLVSGYDQLAPMPVDNTLLLSYRFPLAYPDWSIGPLAYIKRFRSGLFADFQNVRVGTAFAPRTLGVELRADMNLLRYYLPNFDIGVKLVYANEANAPRKVFATYGFSYTY